SGWRWPLVWASLVAGAVGYLFTRLPEWAELAFGIPAILLAFGLIIWRFGFTSEDRMLFRFREA
ncbi:MAG: lipopolysaccharide biosynthesis protein, partial [Alphaproteobacteria bacterium]